MIQQLMSCCECNASHLRKSRYYLARSHQIAVWLKCTYSALQLHKYLQFIQSDTPCEMLQSIVVQGRALQMIVCACLVTFVALEATHFRAQSHTTALLKASASFACFCLVLLAVQAGMLFRGVLDNLKGHRQW